MALRGVLGALKVTAETIAGLWEQAVALVEWLGQVQQHYTGGTQFLKFAQIARSFEPGMTLQQASPLYQAAKYFADQGKYLGSYPADVPIDRRLAEPVRTKSGFSSSGTVYRYRVTLVITGLPDGIPLVKNIWVPTNYELSRSEIQERAMRTAVRNWQPNYTPEEFGGTGKALDVEMEINEFQRFYA